MSAIFSCSNGSGTSVGYRPTVYPYQASQTIAAGHILEEVASGGGDILEEAASGGGSILEENATTGVGLAIALMAISVPSPFVWVTPRATNTGTVWIWDSTVGISYGVPLVVGAHAVFLPIKNLNDIYIIGNSGDIVDFEFGSHTIYRLDDDGNLMYDDDGYLMRE